MICILTVPNSRQTFLSNLRKSLMAHTQEFIATGRRKTSVARIRMTAGNGKIDINGKSFEDYFPTVSLQNTVLQPLQVAKVTNSYNLLINTAGGGPTGQAGAVRLAISRALLQVDAESAWNVEGGGIAPPRSTNEGAQEVRPTRSTQALPVLEAIISISVATSPVGRAGLELEHQDGFIAYASRATHAQPQRHGSRLFGVPRLLKIAQRFSAGIERVRE